MAAVLFRGFSRNCLRAGSNGISRASLTPQMCRAFAVAPFRAALGTPAPASTPLLSRVVVSQQPPSRSSSSGDHVKLWTAERAVSMLLLGAIPVAMLVPSPAVETFLALSLTLHSHWGIEALVHDYMRPSMFGEIVPRVCVSLVYALSVMTFGGLCYFIYTDVGLINAVAMFWRL